MRDMKPGHQLMIKEKLLLSMLTEIDFVESKADLNSIISEIDKAIAS